MGKRMRVAVDGTGHSRTAVSQAANLAKCAGAESIVALVNVVLAAAGSPLVHTLEESEAPHTVHAASEGARRSGAASVKEGAITRPEAGPTVSLYAEQLISAKCRSLEPDRWQAMWQNARSALNGIVGRGAYQVAPSVGVAIVLLSSGIVGAEATQDEKFLEWGRALAEANCARCHNIAEIGDSPFSPAPPFRVIARIYRASDLEEAFVEGIVVGHPAMPEFRMDGSQAAALSTFIESLER